MPNTGRVRNASAVILIGSTLLLSACGSDDESSTPPSSASSTSPAPSAAVASKPFVLTVSNGHRTAGPDTIEVKLGDTVTVEVTSDQADEVHVHGYDRTLELPPGVAATLAFTADIPGSFEVELHSNDAVLTQLRVSG